MSLVQQNNVTHSAPLRFNQRGLLPAFWLTTLLIVIYEIFWSHSPSIYSFFATAIITFSALLPSYLWCSARVVGIPIYPLFALTFLWTYGFPLISEHPIVQTYSPEAHFEAGLVCTFALFLGTLTWFKFANSLPKPSHSYRVLSLQSSNQFFLLCLILGCFLNIIIASGWTPILLGNLFSTIQAAILGLVGISVFVLSYKLGENTLRRETSLVFLFFLVVYIISNAVGLLLVGAASIFLISIIAYVIGSQHIPIKTIFIFGLCFMLLHFGKGEMRAKYWFSGQSVTIHPWEYPIWYSEWFGYSLDYLNIFDLSPDSSSDLNVQSRKQSILERSSLIHLFLLVQAQSPHPVPYLHGATYKIIPSLLIPRYFNPDKVASHEGTYLLNIHYGLQRRQDTLRTTIGWGIFAESYANYGVLGCFTLTIFLGAFYGKLAAWNYGAPLLSDRSLLSILVLTLAFQSEFSAGVYVAALFQGFMLLLAVFIFLMRTYKNPVSLNTLS